MRKRFVLTCLVLLSGRLATADEKDDAARLKRELPGTWECTSQDNLPPDVEFIKYITPTNWSWVMYDRGKNAILSAAGGTWKIKDGHYEETCEYSINENLRGKTFPFSIRLAGDKWDHKSLPDGELKVDEVWSRCKPAATQKANATDAGRKLLGSWEVTLGTNAPKSGRMFKHITPTHWTWVAFDRENRQVVASAGGTWTLRNGEYVETCLFSTDNFPQGRGNSYAFQYQLEGNRWILKTGPGRIIAQDETWTLLK